MSSLQIHDIGRRRAWSIWLVALSVYVLAVLHRSSLGVAGLLAAERFHINATSLATFTVLQLVVYAAMQVPVGVMLDRYGSRAMLLVGLAMMTVGQLVFAFTTSFGGAVLARAVLGAGDAMIFVSVIRLVTVWFLVRQAPMITQLTGLVGQMGAIVAAAPLAFLLDRLGWTGAFGLVSSLGIVLLVAVAMLVKDSPYRRDEVVQVKLPGPGPVGAHPLGQPRDPPGHVVALHLAVRRHGLHPAVGLPVPGAGTRLVRGRREHAADGHDGVGGGERPGPGPPGRPAALLAVVDRHRGRRAGWSIPWTAVLLWPGVAPSWVVVVMACATATGGPAAMVGFDLARTFTPVQAIGRANGLVNVGGFTASLLTMALIGVVLDVVEPGGMDAYTLDDYRLALSVQYLFWGFGVVQILRYRRRGLAHLARVHPGATEQMKAGRPFVHPGIGTEGV